MREYRYAAPDTIPAKITTAPAKRGGGKVLRGYAATFFDKNDRGTEYNLVPGKMVERIAPGAFDRALRERDDCLALYGHNLDILPLGRVSAGTLRLRVDSKGLLYEVDLPAWATDLAESVERGDIRGSSFSFKVEEAGEEYLNPGLNGGPYVRVIRSFSQLFDVSPTPNPAYAASTVGLRTLLDALEQKRFTSGAQPIPSLDLWRMRLQLAEATSY